MPWKEWKIMGPTGTVYPGLSEWGTIRRGRYVQRMGSGRPTGDKWLARYHAQGVAGLADLSRRPHTQPHHTPAALVARIVAIENTAHPSFGPKKIRDRLRAEAPGEAWPVG